jgi:hypothetical protein
MPWAGLLTSSPIEPARLAHLHCSAQALWCLRYQDAPSPTPLEPSWFSGIKHGVTETNAEFHKFNGECRTEFSLAQSYIVAYVLKS